MVVATRKRIVISEALVAAQWERMVGRELTTVGGERLKVLYPGRANGGRGPDYRDAVVVLNRCNIVKGDVECHVRSGDWYGHGHHADPEYDGVILHVVAWDKEGVATVLRNDVSVPVLSLPCDWQLLTFRRLRCAVNRRDNDGERLAELLRRAGEERFRLRAELLEGEERRLGGGEALWRGIMRGLGYSENMKPFEKLARLMPLGVLERGRLGRSLLLKQACLLGVGGLLPSQRGENGLKRWKETGKWEEIWRVEGRGAVSMSRAEWRMSHVYPNNSPVRRTLAAGCLLQRHSREGLLEGMLRLVRGAPEPSGHRWLESSLVVMGDGWLAEGHDSGSRMREPSLIGRSKAAEILVNVILPFAFGWGGAGGEPDLRRKALRLYSGYPGLADNAITHHMAGQLGWGNSRDLTACRQQGLIHIFRTYCREGRCCVCPVPRQW